MYLHNRENQHSRVVLSYRYTQSGVSATVPNPTERDIKTRFKLPQVLRLSIRR